MKKIIYDMKEYFLPADLYLNPEKLDHNFYFYKNNKEEIEKFTHDDAINDWLIERIRRFNMSTFYLVNSIEKMIFFWSNFNNADKSNIPNKDILDNFETNLRIELRNTCINISIYIDKIKSLCRYYFFLDEIKTEKGNVFIETLKQYKSINPIINTFCKNCVNLQKNIKYDWIYNIRNSEIHNESFIDMHNFAFDPDPTSLKILDKGYKIGNEEILDNIQEVLNLILIIRNNLQEILEKISCNNVRLFIEQNTWLKNIVKTEKRADCNKNVPLIPADIK